MKLSSMILNEIRHRKKNFLWGAIAVATAIGVVSGSRIVLETNRIVEEHAIEKKIAETEKEMHTLWDDMRRATLKLSFNLLILPEDTDLKEWHLRGESNHYMPEDYAHKIASSDIVMVRHFLPILQQRVLWPETGRTIILVGSKGEVPHKHKSPRAPLQQAVPSGSIVLGNELQKISGASEGDVVKLMDRSFTVHKIHEKRGTRDDITAWIPLETAQELLDKKGLVNAIMALECVCAGAVELQQLVDKLEALLPDIQVREQGSKVIARAETRARASAEAQAIIEREKKHRAELRRERERFMAILVPVVMLTGAIWIGLIGYSNIKQRTTEVAVLRAVGVRFVKIVFLSLCRSCIFGLVGGLAGYLAGTAIGAVAGNTLAGNPDLLPPWTTWLSWAGLVGSVSAAAMLAVLAGWIPAFWATRIDPAEILWEE